MAHVTRSAVIEIQADQLWKRIGDFQALHNWHPAVAQSRKTTDSHGAELRHLTLGDGGEIVEKLHGHDGMSYGYEIVESPLPVKDYHGVITVIDAGKGQSVLVWSSVFTPLSDDAEQLIGGVYEAGLNAL